MLKNLARSVFALPVLLAAMLLLAPVPAHPLDLALDGNLRLQCGTATASGGAATLANKCGVITSESLLTANGSDYTLTLTNTVAAAADLVLWSVDNGTNTTGAPIPQRALPAAGSIVFVVKNLAGGATGTGSAFTGTIRVRYLVVKP